MNIGESFICWARDQRAVCLLLLIGSRARHSHSLGLADSNSDWDFHVVSDRPEVFDNSGWMDEAGLSSPLNYVVRSGRFGYIRKVSVILPDGEMDIVLIPRVQLSLLRWIVYFRLEKALAFTRKPLVDLSTVLGHGYVLVKGSDAWKAFLRRVSERVCGMRLDDGAVCSLADGFVCDYMSAKRKICRGEILAAQRWLHCSLADANFALLHELRLRSGETSFPDARRIELISPKDNWQSLVTVAGLPDSISIDSAVEKSAATCRALVSALVGERWKWPELLPIGK